MPQDAVLTPEELGQQAAAAVKGATTAALSAATVRRERQAAAAARDQQFPSLATVSAALPSPQFQPPARPLPRPAAAAAPAQPPHQAAFSDDDETQVQQPAEATWRAPGEDAQHVWRALAVQTLRPVRAIGSRAQVATLRRVPDAGGGS